MDDKKKMIVVGALALVMACVGVQRLLGGSGAPPPPPPAPATKPAPDAAAKGTAAASKAPEVKNPQVANELPNRDPFGVPEDVKPKSQNQLLAEKAHPMSGSVSFKGARPSGLRPLPLGDLRDLKASPLPTGHPNPALDNKEFGYKVVGTISGVKPEVLIEDSAGNQKLVPVGGAVDGDSQVKDVANGAVTIDYRGKKLRLTVGGNPGGK